MLPRASRLPRCPAQWSPQWIAKRLEWTHRSDNRRVPDNEDDADLAALSRRRNSGSTPMQQEH